MAGGSDAVETTALSCAECGKTAHLQCPKCVELKLPRESAAFCSQDCFKASWSSHKSVHLKATLSPATENAGEQNSNLATDGWLYCLRKGQSRTAKLPHFEWTGGFQKLNPTVICNMLLRSRLQINLPSLDCLFPCSVKPGVRFRELGEIINRHASMAGLSVVKSYCGHGIGELFHCSPNIPHF